MKYQAIKPILDKEANNLSQAMLINSLRITPLAALSRGICGVRDSTLIVTLPGSLKAVSENLVYILPILKHAIDLIQNDNKSSSIFHQKLLEQDPKKLNVNINGDVCKHRSNDPSQPSTIY